MALAEGCIIEGDYCNGLRYPLNNYHCKQADLKFKDLERRNVCLGSASGLRMKAGFSVQI
jgi:hypothetical protein